MNAGHTCPVSPGPVSSGPVSPGSARSITVLGSTGSVGTQTIELLAADPDRFQVRALVAGRNAAMLAEQAKALRAQIAVVADPACYAALRDALAGSGIETAAGSEAVIAAAALDADWTMAAITGAAGLAPTLAAIRRGRCVSLANKEALVCAGDVMLHAVRTAGATLLPVDSEHNAIFQSLADGNRGAVEKIVLTASGGPFRTASLDQMAQATPEMALRHPVWSMGAKISIDSATMMNKGLEVIEAARLFDLAETRIEVLVHPQSVIHGMVHYHDGSVLAQLGSPDMRIPIAHTLAWPQRLATVSPRLDLTALGRLDFEAPDLIRFPALRVAREALQAGGGTPTILNAANEVAVAAFLDRRIGFLDIVRTTERVLQRLGTPKADTLDQVIALDARARRIADDLIAAHVRSNPAAGASRRSDLPPSQALPAHAV
ncbi:1-deoxy-D-xylulose-5-phosphate reductoisomerase [Rhodopila sp.]|uniref:1-deoxy-D-xylulose-5-phosphate reductoisomerase n=1 Tax=Rhodopila sp. TaxID=2480087 RepID=UPI003D09C866